MVRFKAILKCLYHGIMPYWMYEEKRHYDCSYWYHLRMNIHYALKWVLFLEDGEDIKFESETNNNS